MYRGQTSQGRHSPGGLSAISVLGTFAWYRVGLGLTSASGLVSQWNDQSGNANHLTASAGGRPTLQSDNSLLFDGVGNFMQTAGFTLNQPFTIAMLLKQVAWTSGNFITDGLAVGTSIKQEGGTSGIRLNAGATFAGPNPGTFGTFVALAGVFNGATSVLNINNNNEATGNASTNGLDGLTLGASRVPSLFANVAVKELILFSAALTGPQRAMVVNYLRSAGGG